MSNMISSPSLIATFLFPACWERPHGNCELFMLDTSSLIFTAHSMKGCWDKFMEKLLSRTGCVGKCELCLCQLCSGTTSVPCSAVTGRRSWTITRAGKPPECPCHPENPWFSIVWSLRGGKRTDFKGTGSSRKLHGENNFFGSSMVSAPTLPLLAVQDLCSIMIF